MGDLGLEVVEDVAIALSLDAEWTVREERGFSWWGHKLRQRVWADPPRRSHGNEIVRIHAQTALLSGVSVGSNAYAVFARENRSADMSALVVDPRTGALYAHCNAYFHAGNRWLINDFKTSVALQVARAHRLADVLRDELGGAVAESGHPISGLRSEPDDILTVGAMITGQGARRSSFGRGQFADGARQAQKMLVLATYDEDGVAAEVPFTGAAPVTLDHELTGPDERHALTAAYVSAARQLHIGVPQALATTWLNQAGMREQSTETALVQIRSGEPHPDLGYGLLMLLWLPVNFDSRSAAQVASDLNEREADSWTDTHLLGAWSTSEAHVVYTSFLPNLVIMSADAAARSARVTNALVSMVIRARWAAQQVAR